MAYYCTASVKAAVKCEVFDCLAVALGAASGGRGLWLRDASLAMKDLHNNDAPRSQQVGIWRWRVGKHVVLL
jgi:hypothetical protein